MEFLSSSDFFPQVINLGYQAILIILEFFTHKILQSGERRSNDQAQGVTKDYECCK
jgi:hypothetical protein